MGLGSGVLKRSAWVGALSCCWVTIAACTSPQFSEVDLANVVDVQTEPAHVPGLRLAVGAMTAPEASLDGFLLLRDLLARRLDKPVTLVFRRSYRAVNSMLLRGEADIGFVCTGAYINLRREAPTEVLALPVVGEKASYRSYVIGPAERGFQRLEDLAGLRFAFTDVLSNTGYYYPMSLLAERGLTAERFFRSVVFTRSHDSSIHAVARGRVDAAAVDSLVFDHLRRNEPTSVRGLSVFLESGDFASPPAVALKSVPEELRNWVRQSLLSLHETTEGQVALRSLGASRFVSGDEDLFDPVEELVAKVDGHR